MRRLLLPAAALTLLGSCGFVHSAGVEAAWMQTELSGTVALEPEGGGPTSRTDVQSELGLDQPSGSPLVGATVDTVAGRIRVSGFRFRQTGAGRLDSSFGDIPAGTPVSSDVEIWNIRAHWSYDLLDGEHFRLGPGLGIDWFSIDAGVESTTPVSAFERIQVSAPVPMLFVDGGVGVDPVYFDVVAGGMALELGDVSGTFWDLDGRLRVTPIDVIDVFAGYRWISVDADGQSDGQRYEADIELRGWYLGGGIRF